MVAVFREVRRVLRDDGTCWMNLGDSYNNRSVARNSSHQTGLGFESPDLSKLWADLTKEGRTRLSLATGGLKEKDLVGIPWRVAFALQADGWYLRSDIIWAKPNPMPESVTDRPTKAHEYLFLLSKSARYWYDADAVSEESVYPAGYVVSGSLARQGEDAFVSANAHRGPTPVLTGRRNRRSVWTVATNSFPDAHFATFPPKLIEPCVLAGCPVGGTVLDPFCGSGTTGVVALNNHRQFVGIELNPEYVAMARRRIERETAQQRMPV